VGIVTVDSWADAGEPYDPEPPDRPPLAELHDCDVDGHLWPPDEDGDPVVCAACGAVR
jgi:hypothetical protein